MYDSVNVSLPYRIMKLLPVAKHQYLVEYDCKSKMKMDFEAQLHAYTDYIILY